MQCQLASARLRGVTAKERLTVVNRSGKEVRVSWVGYDGEPVQYAVLPDTQTWTTDTYSTHYWLVESSDGSFRNAFCGDSKWVQVVKRGVLNVGQPWGEYAVRGSSQGLKITAFDCVSRRAVKVAERLVDRVLQDAPAEVLEGLHRAGCRVAIIGRDQVPGDIPEHSYLRLLLPTALPGHSQPTSGSCDGGGSPRSAGNPTQPLVSYPSAPAPNPGPDAGLSSCLVTAMSAPLEPATPHAAAAAPPTTPSPAHPQAAPSANPNPTPALPQAAPPTPASLQFEPTTNKAPADSQPAAPTTTSPVRRKWPPPPSSPAHRPSTPGHTPRRLRHKWPPATPADSSDESPPPSTSDDPAPDHHPQPHKAAPAAPSTDPTPQQDAPPSSPLAPHPPTPTRKELPAHPARPVSPLTPATSTDGPLTPGSNWLSMLRRAHPSMTTTPPPTLRGASSPPHSSSPPAAPTTPEPATAAAPATPASHPPVGVSPPPPEQPASPDAAAAAAAAELASSAEEFEAGGQLATASFGEDPWQTLVEVGQAEEGPAAGSLPPLSLGQVACRGLLATREIPVLSCCEENLLLGPTNAHKGESVLVHGLARAVWDFGLDSDLRMAVRVQLQKALDKGLYPGGCRMTSSAEEYWAEGARAWFSATVRAEANGGINTREKLLARDPGLARLLDEAFGDGGWRYWHDCPGQVGARRFASTAAAVLKQVGAVRALESAGEALAAVVGARIGGAASPAPGGAGRASPEGRLGGGEEGDAAAAVDGKAAGGKAAEEEERVEMEERAAGQAAAPSSQEEPAAGAEGAAAAGAPAPEGQAAASGAAAAAAGGLLGRPRLAALPGSLSSLSAGSRPLLAAMKAQQWGSMVRSRLSWGAPAGASSAPQAQAAPAPQVA